MFMILQYQLSTGGGGNTSDVIRRSVGMGLYKSDHEKPGGSMYCCDKEFSSPILNVDIPVNITPNYYYFRNTGEGGYIEERDKDHYPSSSG